MRKINKIIVHCSATRIDQNFDVEDIRRWHTSEPRNWSDIGYHVYIKLDGTVQAGRPIERSGAHTKGHNSDSIGVCFEGGYLPNGVLWDEPLEAQQRSFIDWLVGVDESFGKLPIHGHKEFSNKSCPGFDVSDILYWNWH